MRHAHVSAGQKCRGKGGCSASDTGQQADIRSGMSLSVHACGAGTYNCITLTSVVLHCCVLPGCRTEFTLQDMESTHYMRHNCNDATDCCPSCTASAARDSAAERRQLDSAGSGLCGAGEDSSGCQKPGQHDTMSQRLPLVYVQRSNISTMSGNEHTVAGITGVASTALWLPIARLNTSVVWYRWRRLWHTSVQLPPQPWQLPNSLPMAGA